MSPMSGMGPSFLWAAASSVQVHQSPCPVIVASPSPVWSEGWDEMAPLQSFPVQEGARGLFAAVETRRGAGLILHPTSDEGCELQPPFLTLPGVLRNAPWWQFHAWVNRAGRGRPQPTQPCGDNSGDSESGSPPPSCRCPAPGAAVL